MNKISLIIQREYFSRVRKKMFLITTLVVPIVMIAFYVLIIFLSKSDSSEKQRIAIIDDANLFNEKITSANKNLTFQFIHNETEQSYLKKFNAAGFQSFLFIPHSIDATTNKNFVLHSEKAVNLSIMDDVESLINDAIRSRVLIANGINPVEFEKKSASAQLDNIIDTENGAQKSFTEIAYIISLICGFLIYIMMMSYGTQVMRGVSEEKTNRIAEVIVSSVKPFELMVGKIIGIGAVGITQFLIWIILLFLLQAAIPMIYPDVTNQINNAALESKEGVMALNSVLQGVSALPMLKIVSFFLFYFMGGYLLYASIFAAIGSVVSEDHQEAQQLVTPVLMPIIVGFVIMSKSVDNPNSTEAVIGSIFPFTSPIVMMGRITADVPLWQTILSMSLLVATIIVFTWFTAKVYRTGILMYGKKVSWKEIFKWAFKKN